jgi:hypothetical protein
VWVGSLLSKSRENISVPLSREKQYLFRNICNKLPTDTLAEKLLPQMYRGECLKYRRIFLYLNLSWQESSIVILSGGWRLTECGQKSCPVSFDVSNVRVAHINSSLLYSEITERHTERWGKEFLLQCLQTSGRIK